MAMSAEEIDLLEKSERNKTAAMVGHTLFNPAVCYLKELIDTGELGEIYYAYSQRLNLGIVRQDVNAL